jgi:hypothetical protein
MSAATESYLKVAYDLRPAKQIERRMFIDGLQRLALAGFDIGDYQYTGFGSIFFVDFILFHKLLGLQRLLSVEHSLKIEKRVKFNRPFKQIEILMESITDVIPTLSADRKHLLWLDYDDVLQKGHIADLFLAGTYLPPGSILLVTVDAEPPGAEQDGPPQWKRHFEDQAGDYLGSFTQLEDFAESHLLTVNTRILERAIASGLVAREARFLPLFWFGYQDGHKMLTLGGMIATDSEIRKVEGSTLPRANYYRGDFSGEPYSIRVPNLTRKERMFLDCEMPCDDGWTTHEFEVDPDSIRDYREVYRYLPAYAELLL